MYKHRGGIMEQTKKEVYGTLWISRDEKGREVVSGNIGETLVYGYINEVEIKKGKNKGKKMKNIKIYKKQNILKQTQL